MKLISIKLCNFRQFYGKTPEIHLANGTCNTTIIHGNNGAGKTTILNAFTWVLYEKFTAAFASPQYLVNKQAITEVKIGTSVECGVEVLFEHEHKLYQVKRKCYVYKNEQGKTQYGENKLFMQIGDEDGRWYPPIEQPIDIIQGILPDSLHQYFFFDGERIDHIFRADQNNKIAEDTKELLGVKVLDRAIEHLKKAKRTLQDELKEIGDLEIKKILQEHSELEKQRGDLLQAQQELKKKIAQLEEFKPAINQRFLELSATEELQRLKFKLEKQAQSLHQNLIQARQTIQQSISSSGYGVFLLSTISDFQNLVKDLRSKGELTTGITKQFVAELLSRQRCICGHELLTDTEPYEQVKAWVEKAGIADVEESAIRLEAQVEEIDKQVDYFWELVDTQQQNRHQWRMELAQVENELDKLKNKLRNSPHENIKNLQSSLDKIESDIREFTLEQGVKQQQIDSINQEIFAKSKQIEKQKIKELKQVLAKNRITATQSAIERITEVRTRLERLFRLSLEQRVQEIFSSISFTPYIPRLSENYELKLIENTSGFAVNVAASTGENQILSLSFIGGIIDRVREWSKENTLMGPDSSTFPIVMDSPFGSLDAIYRRRVAQSIPQLANQLVILVTKTQWRREVEQEMENYVGKEYVLVYHSPKLDCEVDMIQLNGVNYPLVKPSEDQFEYTEIIEVQRQYSS